jgi:hypothetical protein
MRQQLVALDIDDLIFCGQPLRQRRIRLDSRQMGQEDGFFSDHLPRGHIFNSNKFQYELRRLHRVEDHQRSVFSCHLSDTFHSW